LFDLESAFVRQAGRKSAAASSQESTESSRASTRIRRLIARETNFPKFRKLMKMKDRSSD